MPRQIPTDPTYADHPVHPQCHGHACTICGNQAHHKVGEEYLDGQERLEGGVSEMVGYTCRHNLTSYLCCGHFRLVIGGTGLSWCRPVEFVSPEGNGS